MPPIPEGASHSRSQTQSEAANEQSKPGSEAALKGSLGSSAMPSITSPNLVIRTRAAVDSDPMHLDSSAAVHANLVVGLSAAKTPPTAWHFAHKDEAIVTELQERIQRARDELGIALKRIRGEPVPEDAKTIAKSVDLKARSKAIITRALSYNI